MSTCADVGSFIESKTSVVQASKVGFTSEVADYLVVHTGPAQTVARDFTLRQMLLIKLFVSPSHSILTPGKPVPNLVTPGAWRDNRRSANL